MPKLKKLKPYHELALVRKYEGKNYYEIAREFKLSVDTVKSWFRRKNGFLRKPYERYRQKQWNKFLSDARKEVREEMRKKRIAEDLVIYKLLGPRLYKAAQKEGLVKPIKRK